VKYSIHAGSTTGPAVKPGETGRVINLPLSATHQRGRVRREIAWAIAALAVLLLALASFLFLRDGPAIISSGAATQTATAKREDFVSVLRLAGTTEAVRARSVLAPRLSGAQLGSMVVTKLVPAGARVRKGGLLVEFDRQAQFKDFLDKQAAYRSLVDQVAEKKAAEDAARAADETALKQAADAAQTAQLEVSKDEIVSRIDAEKNQETLEEAQATLKQLRQTFKLKRQAAAAGIRSLEIQEDRARATMLYAQSNAAKMAILSPMDGIVVLNTIWLGGRIGQVQEGDEVQAGVPFMKVVDPSEMDVRVDVDQADLPRLRIGQNAVVQFDAYPGLSFPGTLEELAPLGQTGQFSDKVRTFVAIFSIHGNNAKLMPDLSAAVDVQLDHIRNALVVPCQSVVSEDGRQYVWLKTGMGFEKRLVNTGPDNDLESVIDSGLQQGDVIQKNAAESHGVT
jgi:HlyD family secretion protein